MVSNQKEPSGQKDGNILGNNIFIESVQFLNWVFVVTTWKPKASLMLGKINKPFRKYTHQKLPFEEIQAQGLLSEFFSTYFVNSEFQSVNS